MQLRQRPLSVVLKLTDPASEHVFAGVFKESADASGAGPRETLAYRRDGTTLAVEWGLSPAHSKDGAFALVTVTDITERKKSQDELRRSNADLEQFAYIASHDLQEPLRMVASFTELLGRRYKGQLDARADSYIEHAVSGAQRMQHLVRDLLEYSRVGASRRPLVPTDSARVLQQVLLDLGPLIREVGAEVHVGLLPAVMADQAPLAQVFQNLLSNALKFRSSAPPIVSVEGALQDDCVRFSIRDNGIGMEAAYSDRVFLMFQRLHAREMYPGNGIGLAVAKRIIEGFGGTIWVESQPGEGAAFHFTLVRSPV